MDDTTAQQPDADAELDELVITFRKPIKLGDAGPSYESMTLREPTGAEWLQWDRLTGVESNLKAIEVISGLPAPVVKQIGSRDIVRATRFLDRFF